MATPLFGPAVFVPLAAVTASMVWGWLAWRRGLPWSVAVWAGLSMLAFAVLDWVLLVALTGLGLSYAPVNRALGVITAARLSALGLLVVVIGAALLWRRTAEFSGGLNWLWALNLVIVAGSVYAMFVEPFALQTSRITLPGPQVGAGRPLRILHLTDTHIERITRREREVLAQAQALQPDLILLTGDYPNLDYMNDPQTRQEVRWFISQLSAPLGVYAVSGTVDSPGVLADVFDGLPVRLLQDEVQRLEIGGQELYLLGVANLGRERDAAVLQQLASQTPPDAYRILLYHTPDLAEAAAQAGVDLYLAGHTHGGQIRLPWYGAIVTFSAYGKRFEGGLYDVNGTTLFVSRGLGLEGFGLPRARLFCPPEIALFELSSGAGQ